MRTRALVTAAALAATLTACSSGSAAPPDTECEDVDPAIVESIGRGAEDGTGFETTGPAAAYKSPDHASIYFVAAEFTAPGLDREVGVWALTSIDPQGMVLAADGVAQEFTAWPDADSTNFGIDAADPGIRTAKDCLRSVTAGS